MTGHIDSLIYQLEVEQSGRKIAELVKQVAAFGAAASNAVPILQRVRDKVLRESKYKYTRRMIVTEIDRALALITATAPGAPVYEVPRSVVGPPTGTPHTRQNIVTCPQCGASLTETTPGTLKFCTNCGASLTATTSAAPQISTCTACGAVLPDDAKFCTTCGAAVTGY